eukprot:gb/GECG01010888.1/.p1 GENE.gb/GECG01010888.1/~~gb/GECG01010888.1/.p1  ORF type:complete len:416 (+),score=45.05 gb/GECG01010888.1/:1-1248(+)
MSSLASKRQKQAESGSGDSGTSLEEKILPLEKFPSSTPKRWTTQGELVRLQQKFKDLSAIRKESLEFEREEYCFDGHYDKSSNTTCSMIMANNFIDKTEVYQKVVPKYEAGQHCFSVQFPEGGGKTALIDFLQSTLSIPRNTTNEEYKKFVKRLRTMEDGDFFIEQPLSFCLRIDFAVDTIERAREAVRSAFIECGVHIRRDDNMTCANIFWEGLEGLTLVWKAVRPAESPMFKAVVLVDGMDESWKDQASVSEHFPGRQLLREITYITNVLKAESGIFKLMVLTTAKPLPGLGLSSLDLTEVSDRQWFEGLTGVTRSQVQKAIDALPDSHSLIEAYKKARETGDFGKLTECRISSCENPVDYFMLEYQLERPVTRRYGYGDFDSPSLEPVAAPGKLFNFITELRELCPRCPVKE